MADGKSSYERYLSGDDAGLADIIAEYKDPLTLFLCGVTGNFHTAEEAAEETFFILAAKRPRFRGKSSFKTWIYAIAKNTAYKMMKKDSRALPLDEADAAEESALEQSVVADERKRILHGALSNIRGDYRDALYLSYIEGMSNGEISRVMKKNSRQVENLLCRARAALRRELEKEGFTYEDL